MYVPAYPRHHGVPHTAPTLQHHDHHPEQNSHTESNRTRRLYYQELSNTYGWNYIVIFFLFIIVAAFLISPPLTFSPLLPLPFPSSLPHLSTIIQTHSSIPAFTACFGELQIQFLDNSAWQLALLDQVHEDGSWSANISMWHD